MNHNEFRAHRIAHGIWTESGERTNRYTEALIGQIQLWMQGIPTHNRVSKECCPDFSCCHPDMLTSEADRRSRGLRELERYTTKQ